ncbi:MAG: M48 family metalloprotease [Schlesneria sp.]
MIDVACSDCDKEKSANGKGSSTLETASPELSAKILQALNGQIEPVKVTLGYRVAIAVVAALMVLLPMIYLAFIGLVGYGVFWHLVNNTAILTTKVGGRGYLMVVLAYAAPAIIGVVMIAFMLKPLFARRQPKGNDPQTVLRADEPLLFEFVDRLCDVVGAPHPKSILLDDSVNAAAALTSSVWNPFRHDLMLVIGLPLVAGLSLREFAGVLAHEFGHFSQGTGMRLGRIIDSVNRWFAFVVYQRDEWDQSLEQWSKGVDLQIGWVIYAVRGGVWLTRKILHGLMLIGHAMSRRLSREMEFDADRHNARLSGSDAFVSTTYRLPVLANSWQMAISDLSESYRERRLVDDFFRLVTYRAENIPEDVRQKMNDEQRQSKTGWFDTHPSDADRIVNVQRENAKGLLQIEAPASVLFNDFSATCRTETKKFYQRQLSQEIPDSNLVPLENLVARQKAAEQEDKSVGQVLAGLYHFFYAIPLPGTLDPTTSSAGDLLAEIQSLRQRLPSYQSTHSEAITRLTNHFNLLQEARLAETLLQAKMTVGANIFSQPMTNLTQVKAVRETAIEEKREVHESLKPILKDLADRICLPLQLLSIPSVIEKIPDADRLWKESQTLLTTYVELRDCRDNLLSAYDGRQLIRNIFMQLELGGKQETLIPCLMRASDQGATMLNSLREKLQTIEYPFDHIEKGMAVSKYLIEELPQKENPFAVEGILTYAAEQGLLLSSRIIGRLCVIVETVETALGLPSGGETPIKE